MQRTDSPSARLLLATKSKLPPKSILRALPLLDIEPFQYLPYRAACVILPLSSQRKPAKGSFRLLLSFNGHIKKLCVKKRLLNIFLVDACIFNDL